MNSLCKGKKCVRCEEQQDTDQPAMPTIKEWLLVSKSGVVGGTSDEFSFRDSCQRLNKPRGNLAKAISNDFDRK